MDNIESKVIKAFRESDRETLSQITQALKSALKISIDYHLKQYVRNWLSSDNGAPRDILLEHLCSHLPVPTYDDIRKSVIDHHREKYLALHGLVQGYRSPHKTSSCKWVPAAIASRTASISYGGVALLVKLAPTRDGETLYQPRNVVPVSVQKCTTVASRVNPVQYSAPSGTSSVKGSSSGSQSGGQSSSSGSGGSSDGDGGSSRGSGGSRRAGATAAATAAAAAAAKSDEQTKTSKNKATVEKIARKPTKKDSSSITSSTFRGGIPPLDGSFDKFSHGFSSSQIGLKVKCECKRRNCKDSQRFEDLPPDIAKVIWDACNSIQPPPPFLKARDISCKEKGDSNCIYVFVNVSTFNEVLKSLYVGQSKKFQNRNVDHNTSKEKQSKTIGKHTSPTDDTRIIALELPPDTPVRKRHYYEQALMDALQKSGPLMNVKKAMNDKIFKTFRPDHE